MKDNKKNKLKNKPMVKLKKEEDFTKKLDDLFKIAYGYVLNDNDIIIF